MSPLITKILGFITGGLPATIVKEVSEHIAAKGQAAQEKFLKLMAYDMELLKIRGADPGSVRPMVAKTFHYFMWGFYAMSGITSAIFDGKWVADFPAATLFEGTLPGFGEIKLTVGLVYVGILVFYFPLRSVDKWFGREKDKK